MLFQECTSARIDEGIGDEVANHFMALYEGEILFPKLRSFAWQIGTVRITPYVYGMLSCSILFEKKYAGNDDGFNRMWNSDRCKSI